MFPQLNSFKYFATLLLLLSLMPVRSQNQTNNFGKEFRFMLLENYAAPDKVSFAVSFEVVPATIKLSIYTTGLNFINQTVYAQDTFFNITLNAFTMVDKAEETVRNISLLATSNQNFSLYAMNHTFASTEIASIIPTERIPYNPIYYVNTYRGDRNNGSLIGVLAIDDNCRINILPTAESDFRNRFANVQYAIKLRKGQMYMIKAVDTQSFAGTKIWNSNGCKRFAVFEGSRSSFVNYNNGTCQGNDHLYNQCRPLQYLGKSFTTLPFQNLNGGYLYQVVFTENNTELFIDGISQGFYNARDVKLFNNTNNTSVCLDADKPISVIQLMKSANCNGNIIGNPSMMTVLPDKQLCQKVQFSLPTTLNLSTSSVIATEFYLGIVCPKGTLYSLQLNGVKIDTSKFNYLCENAIGNIKLNASLAYKLTSSKGFLAYMYASGKDESYATEIGGGFESKSTELIVMPNITSTCDTGYQFQFKVKSDSAASFNWYFGDGTTNTGDSVSKSYFKIGNFKLKVIANYNGNVGCKTDTFYKDINVYSRPYLKLGKDTTLCNGDIFVLKPLTKPKVSFKWKDGSISNTFASGKSEIVSLTLKDTNNCEFTDTIELTFINCDTNNLKLPNVFTPGIQDDKNDEFEAKFTGFTKITGYIYNRWGVLVYTLDYPNKPFWNGCVNNEISNPCSSGTYYYMYEFTNTKTRFSKKVNGIVQLIR